MPIFSIIGRATASGSTPAIRCASLPTGAAAARDSEQYPSRGRQYTDRARAEWPDMRVRLVIMGARMCPVYPSHELVCRSRDARDCLVAAGITTAGVVVGGVIGGAAARAIAGGIIGGGGAACAAKIRRMTLQPLWIGLFIASCFVVFAVLSGLAQWVALFLLAVGLGLLLAVG